MSVQNGERLVTKQDLADMYQGIRPYLGGMPEVVANKFSKGDLYSTDEKMIGQFIDGKPLYQKTFSGTTPSTVNTSTDFATGLSSLNIEDIIAIDGYLIKPETSTNNTYRRANSLGWSVWANRTVIRQTQSDSSYLNLTAYVILTYTKTTDTAISIGEATEYSTEEKIVGTWITGEPIYQKTIVTTLPAKDVITTVPIGASIENIVDIRTMVVTGTNRSLFQSANALSSQDADTTSFVKIYGHNYLGNNDGNNPNELVLINHIKVSTWDNSPVYVTIQYTKHIST